VEIQASAVAAIAAGGSHTCALTSGGGVKCWGRNSEGQLGDGTTGQFGTGWQLTAVAVAGLSSGITAITAGGFHTCALTNHAGAKCWGFNNFGQIGDSTTGLRPFPGNVFVAGMDPAGSTYSRSYVQKAYVAYYGRPADPGGLTYWATRMDAEGQSLSAIIGAFGYSDEFNRRYGGLSYTQLVTKIYQQTLGRNPDQGGLNYYVGELQAGRRTLQSITLDVLNGATTEPDSTVVANKLDVAAYYTVKVAAGCVYGTEQDGVNALSGVTSVPATLTAAKVAIDSRCGP
jgi:hypothetical protein